ncbi:single-stranded DNA-binding protein [bacterium]|nr:single-stranded DNA-binding protein [Chloroflexi bacterium CFX6]RIL08789.1 MAG: single-stranded DNA-binding protein [bacterium]
MPRSLNKVMLIGFVGREPELRHTPAGVPVTTFSLAVPRAWESPDGQPHTTTEWFTVVAWRELAEQTHAALRKGVHAYVEGSLQTRAWTDPDGRRQQLVEILAGEVVVLDAPPTAPAAEPSAQPSAWPGPDESL